MTFHYDPNNISEKAHIAEMLKQHEIDELTEYCKEQGFTAEQTEIFVRNSIARLFDEDEE